MKKLALFAAVATLCNPAFADETAERNWNAGAELGFNVTSGNSDTESMKLRLEFSQKLESWDTNYIFDTLRKEDNDKESANKWILSGKGDYKLADPKAYLTVGGSREEDKFGAYDNYNKVTVGYGKRLIEEKDLTLSADIGPGYAFYEFAETGESDNSAIVNMSGLLTWKVSDNANFTQKVIVEQELSDDKITKTRLESALTASINGSLKMKLGLTVLNNSKTENRKHTDTETSVTLVYSF